MALVAVETRHERLRLNGAVDRRVNNYSYGSVDILLADANLHPRYHRYTEDAEGFRSVHRAKGGGDELFHTAPLRARACLLLFLRPSTN